MAVYERSWQYNVDNEVTSISLLDWWNIVKYPSPLGGVVDIMK